MSHQFQGIPLGFRFRPTDEELILQYLHPKILESELQLQSWDWIAEKELYGSGAEPRVVLGGEESSPYWESKKGGGVSEEVMYVLSKLQPAAQAAHVPSSRSQRYSRTAGSGTWVGQSGSKEIQGSNVGVIGYKSSFKYCSNNGSADPNDWSMIEYSVVPGMPPNPHNFVICKVTKKPKTLRAAAMIGQDLVTQQPAPLPVVHQTGLMTDEEFYGLFTDYV